MKTRSPIYRLLCIFLSSVMLVNCTAYYPVRRTAEDIRPGAKYVLHKDQLKFKLKEVSIRSDTLYAMAYPTADEPSKKSKLIVVLKPGMQPAQDSTGMLLIPFSSIDYVEGYAIDHRKSTILTVISIPLTLGLILLLFYISFSTGDLLSH